MLARLRASYARFPRPYWVLVAGTFVDVIGESALFPFFALYVTRRFQVGMAAAGTFIGIVSFFGLIGGMIGGALADRFGRRGVTIFGLVSSALAALSLGWVNQLSALYWLAVPLGLLGHIAGPAHHAMVADLLPEKDRAEGYGILRVAANLSWLVGPTIGGFLADRSFSVLFVLDALISLATASIVLFWMPETYAGASSRSQGQGILSTLAGYRTVAADVWFVGFCGVSLLIWGAYQQVYTTLAVFLRDFRGIPAQGYGLLVAVNAVMVVLLQMWVTARIRSRPPALMMAAGALVYTIGLTLIGLHLPFAAMLVIIAWVTLGEMIVVPVTQAIVALLSPEDMRGRYAAFFGLASTLPALVGPWLGGTLMDRFNPDWLWFTCGLACAVAALGCLALHRAMARPGTAAAPKV